MISLRQSTIAGALALLLQVLVLLAFGWLLTAPRDEAWAADRPPPEQSREVVVLTPMEIVEEEERPPEALTFVETSPDQVQEAPERPTNLISDRDTRAASAAEAALEEGPVLPTLEGVEAPGFELADSEFRDGPDEASASDDAATSDMPGEMPAEEQDTGELVVVEPGEADEPGEAAAPGIDLPELVPLPEVRPLPDLAEQEEREPADDADGTAEKDGLQPRVDSGAVADSGFQPQRRQRTFEGTISQSGVDSLDAEDTPLGRYLRQVSRVITRDWQRACRRNENMVHIRSGFVRVGFSIDRNGRVVGARAIDVRDAGQIQTLFTVEAVRNATLPPIPAEVREMLPGETLEMAFNFLFF